MNSATLLLVIFATAIAFWTGSRWRHNARTWSDTRGAKSAWKTMKKTRWVTLKAALIAVVATVGYLLGTGAISLVSVRTPARTPTAPHTTPANNRSSHSR